MPQRNERSETFETSLGRAEEMLRQADGWRERVAFHRTILVLSRLATAAVVAVVMTRAEASGPLRAAACAVLVLVAFAVSLALQRRVIAPLQHLVRRDDRHAAEIASVLRELLPFVAEEEEWDVFRNEQARLRLSRFPVEGEGP